MVSSNPKSGISGVRLSSVVPARITGDNKEMELTNLDLAMKLHYIKGVYFFESEAVRGLTVYELKAPMFKLLETYYPGSGRIRLSEMGRPFIKCNDGGVRIVEAQCDKTVEEWLAMEDCSLDGCLAYDQVLGPDLGFSPLVFVQFTWFKCGGMAIGLSWAHVLGDAFSASDFINNWGRILSGKGPSKSPGEINSTSSFPGKPFPLEKVSTMGDCWKIDCDCNMQTHSFLCINDPNQTANLLDFETISAVIWKSISKIRGNIESKKVTTCRKNVNKEMPNNGLVFSMVETESSVAKLEIAELARMIANDKVDENYRIEDMLEGIGMGGEGSDSVVYGANLTFLNMEEGDFYGLELKGKKPVFVNYMINGVGSEGLVLVLPGPPQKDGGKGQTVTMVLPEGEIVWVKKEIQKYWNIV
ncbi:hypothetical protein SLA2020_333570 [Shorea laevis]